MTTDDEKVLYRTSATAVGDGRSGRVLGGRDGDRVTLLSVPAELGGDGGPHTNPEELFASGYAACFHSALRSAARRARVTIEDSAVTVSVALVRRADGSYGIEAALEVRIPSVPQSTAEQLMADAHRACPYSNLMRDGGHVRLGLAT